MFQGPVDQLRAGEANVMLGPIVGERPVLLFDGPQHLRHRRLTGGPFHGRGMKTFADELLYAEIARRRADTDALEGRDERYLDAVVKESLRLRPVIPGVGRVVRGELFRLNGYEIPPGIEIDPSIRVMHRRDDLYPDASAFRPERFLGDNPPDTYTWIPLPRDHACAQGRRPGGARARARAGGHCVRAAPQVTGVLRALPRVHKFATMGLDFTQRRKVAHRSSLRGNEDDEGRKFIGSRQPRQRRAVQSRPSAGGGR